MHLLILILCSLMFPAPSYASDENIEWYEKNFPDRVRARIQKQFDGFFERIRIPSDGNPPKIVLFPNDGSTVGYVSPKVADTVFINADYYVAQKNDGRLLTLFAHELRHLEPDQRNRNHQHRREQNEIEAGLEALATRLFRIGQNGPDGNPEPAVVEFESIFDEMEKERAKYTNHYLKSSDEVIFLRSLYARERTRRTFPKKNKPLDSRLRAIVHQVLSSPSLANSESSPQRKERDEYISPERRTVTRIVSQSSLPPIEQLKLALSEVIRHPTRERQDELKKVLNIHFQDDIEKSKKPKWHRQFSEFPLGFFETLAKNHTGYQGEWDELGRIEALLLGKEIDFSERLSGAFLTYTTPNGPAIFSERLLQRHRKEVLALAKDNPEALLYIAGSPLFRSKWLYRRSARILTKALKKIPPQVIEKLTKNNTRIPEGLESLPPSTLKKLPRQTIRTIAEAYRGHGDWAASEKICRTHPSLYREYLRAAKEKKEMGHLIETYAERELPSNLKQQVANAIVQGLKTGQVDNEIRQNNRFLHGSVKEYQDLLERSTRAFIRRDQSQRRAVASVPRIA